MREELIYTSPEMMADSPRAWADEAYYAGLSGALDTVTGSFDLLSTPSGAPASPQAAQPSATSPGWLQSLVQGVTQVLPVAAQAYSAKKLTDINIDRARQGLQPLSPQQYQQLAPQAQVRVGMDDATKKLLLWGGGIALGLVALRAAKVI